jgi:hypothetical protein
MMPMMLTGWAAASANGEGPKAQVVEGAAVIPAF